MELFEGNVNTLQNSENSNLEHRPPLYDPILSLQRSDGLDWLDKLSELRIETIAASSAPATTLSTSGEPNEAGVSAEQSNAARNPRFSSENVVARQTDHEEYQGKGKNPILKQAEDQAADDEIDVDDAITLDLLGATLTSSRKAIEKTDYGTAETDLKEALSLLSQLPAQHRNLHAVASIHFCLAVCAFHINDSAIAETALLSFVNTEPQSDREALDLCCANHLLSLLYVRSDKLDLAQAACESAYRGHRTILGKDHKDCYRSLALLARLHELQGNHARARALFGMIPDGTQKIILQQIRNLGSPPESQLTGADGDNTELPSYSGSGQYTVEKTTAKVPFYGKMPRWASTSKIIQLPSHETDTEPYYKIMQWPKVRGALSFVDEDGKLLAATDFKRDSIVIIDTTTGKQVHQLRKSSGFSGVPVMDSNSIPKRLLIACGGSVQHFNAERGKLISTTKVNVEKVYFVASPTWSIWSFAASSSDGTVRLWQDSAFPPGKTLEGFNSPGHLAFSPLPGKRLATADGTSIFIWDVDKWTQVHKLTGHRSPVHRVAWSVPYGKYLASVDSVEDSELKIWDTYNATEIKSLKGYHGDLAFSPFGGEYLACMHRKGFDVLETTNWTRVCRLRFSNIDIESLAFKPSAGMTLATLTHDGTVLLWDIHRIVKSGIDDLLIDVIL